MTIAAPRDIGEKHCFVWCGHEDCQCRRQTREKYSQELERFVAQMKRTGDPDLRKFSEQIHRLRVE